MSKTSSGRYRRRWQPVCGKVSTVDQAETEEIATTEVVNGGEPAELCEGEPIVDEECQ